MKKLSILYFFGPLLILSLALVIFSGPAQAYVYDAFTSVGIDTSKWINYGPDKALFTQPGGVSHLQFNDPTPGGNMDSLESVATVNGSFFVSMYYTDYKAKNTATGDFSGSSVELWIGAPGNSGISVHLYEYIRGQNTKSFQQGIWALINDSGTKHHVNSTYYSTLGNTSGSLGIGYNSITGLVTLYYDLGSGWKEFGTCEPDFPSGPLNFGIEGYDPDGTSLRFQVDQVDIVPLPPSLFLLGSGLLGLGALGWRRQG
jgi:hypothetical protein